MHPELRSCRSQRRQCRHGGDLTALEVQTGARIDVAEGELDNVCSEIRRDVAQAGDDLADLRLVDLAQAAQAAFITLGHVSAVRIALSAMAPCGAGIFRRVARKAASSRDAAMPATHAAQPKVSKI